MDITIDECDQYIKNDLVWRDRAIKVGETQYCLPAADTMIGQKMKIKELLLSK